MMDIRKLVKLLDDVGQMAEIMRRDGLADDNQTVMDRAEGYWLGAKEMFESMALANGVPPMQVNYSIRLIEDRHPLLRG